MGCTVLIFHMTVCYSAYSVIVCISPSFTYYYLKYFCEFFQQKFKRLNNVDKFSQPSLLIFSKGANFSKGHCMLKKINSHSLWCFKGLQKYWCGQGRISVWYQCSRASSHWDSVQYSGTDETQKCFSLVIRGLAQQAKWNKQTHTLHYIPFGVFVLMGSPSVSYRNNGWDGAHVSRNIKPQEHDCHSHTAHAICPYATNETTLLFQMAVVQSKQATNFFNPCRA